MDRRTARYLLPQESEPRSRGALWLALAFSVFAALGFLSGWTARLLWERGNRQAVAAADLCRLVPGGQVTLAERGPDGSPLANYFSTYNCGPDGRLVGLPVRWVRGEVEP